LKFEKEVKRNVPNIDSLLSERLKVIFDDREMFGIGERKVVTDPQGKVENDDLEKLIEEFGESLADLGSGN
jgi:polyphosphate kinase